MTSLTYVHNAVTAILTRTRTQSQTHRHSVMHGLCTDCARSSQYKTSSTSCTTINFADWRSAEKIGEARVGRKKNRNINLALMLSRFATTEQPPVKRPKLTNGEAPGQHVSAPGGATVVEVKLGPMSEGQETLRKRKLYLA